MKRINWNNISLNKTEIQLRNNLNKWYVLGIYKNTYGYYISKSETNNTDLPEKYISERKAKKIEKLNIKLYNHLKVEYKKGIPIKELEKKLKKEAQDAKH